VVEEGVSDNSRFGLIVIVSIVLLIIAVMIIIIMVMRKQEDDPFGPGDGRPSMKCYCGTEIPPGYTHCPNCGRTAPAGDLHQTMYEKQTSTYGPPSDISSHPGWGEPQQQWQQPGNAVDDYQQPPMAQEGPFTSNEFASPPMARNVDHTDHQEYPSDQSAGPRSSTQSDCEDDGVY